MAVRIEKILREEAKETPAEGPEYCIDASLDLIHAQSTPGTPGAYSRRLIHQGYNRTGDHPHSGQFEPWRPHRDGDPRGRTVW
jgi:hypothetical protein